MSAEGGEESNGGIDVDVLNEECQFLLTTQFCVCSIHVSGVVLFLKDRAHHIC